VTGARRQERLGLVFAALCAIDGAFTAPLAKLNTNLADASFVAAAVTCFGAAFAFAQLALRRELHLLLRRDTAAFLVGIGLLGTAVAFLLYFEGSKRSTAIETTLCVQIEPAYALVLSWIALEHRPTLARVAATAAILAGIAIAVGLEQATGSAGVWLLLATPLAWQLSHLVVLRRLRGAPPHLLTAARYVFGGAFLLAAWLARGGLAQLPSRELWPRLLPTLALQGVVLSWGGTLLWYNAIARLDLARATSIVVPSIPLLSFGASFLVLGEVASPRQWIGLAITAAGVIAFVRAPSAGEAARSTAAAEEEPAA
jgi:drug/metabolite transporter (DMT)-like permease